MAKPVNNTVWDMTEEQYKELKDDLIARDGDDRVLGAVNVGSLRLSFDVESNETRRSLGVAPNKQRIGILLLANPPEGAFLGTLPDGNRYTDLDDFTYDEVRKAMKGRFDTVYELDFNGFKEMCEQWIVDIVHASDAFKNGGIDDSVFNRPIPAWQKCYS